jgi:hypothetical protein
MTIQLDQSPSLRFLPYTGRWLVSANDVSCMGGVSYDLLIDGGLFSFERREDGGSIKLLTRQQMRDAIKKRYHSFGKRAGYRAADRWLARINASGNVLPDMNIISKDEAALMSILIGRWHTLCTLFFVV